MLINKIVQTALSLDVDMSFFEGKKNTFVNPFSYVQCKSLEVAELPNNVFLDGISLVTVMKFQGIKTQRISFDMTSLAPFIFTKSAEMSKSIAIIGGTELEITSFVEKLKSSYGGLDISLSLSGFGYSPDEYLGHLLRVKPDIVILGLGAPLQDKMAAYFFKDYPSTYFTCGGFITQSVSDLQYYPKWVDKLNIRFIYRALKEKHYRKRLFSYPFLLREFSQDLKKFKQCGENDDR